LHAIVAELTTEHCSIHERKVDEVLGVNVDIVEVAKLRKGAPDPNREAVPEAGIPVAADESCRSAHDALRIARDGFAQVVNIKLAKYGVVEAPAIAAIAGAANIDLTIGGMVETRLAIGFSAHFAAVLGGCTWIDLDTPLLLAQDSVHGGYVATGAKYDLDVDTTGHGGSLNW
jgi:L-alanine-DL-glutamate epimerase-like enolase superfamily enzyme